MKRSARPSIDNRGEQRVRISVIAPVLNEAQRLPALIARLRVIGVEEIIVVDGGSDDGTYELATTCADIVLASERGRGKQIAAGAARAAGDILWIVHGDSRPPLNARFEISRILQRSNCAFGCFPIRFDDSHPLLALYSATSRVDSMFTTFGDQGYFVRRATYEAIGGAPHWPLFEDVELRRRLSRVGRIYKSKSRIMTSARRFRTGGILRQQIGNFVLLMLFFAGVQPARLAAYYSRFQSTGERRAVLRGGAGDAASNSRPLGIHSRDMK